MTRSVLGTIHNYQSMPLHTPSARMTSRSCQSHRHHNFTSPSSTPALSNPTMKFFAILLVTLVVFVAMVEAAKPATKKPIKKPVTATAFTTCSSDNMCQQSNANKRSICKYELVEGQDSYCTICVALPSIKAHINSKKPNNTCGVCDGAKVCHTATPTSSPTASATTR